MPRAKPARRSRPAPPALPTTDPRTRLLATVADERVRLWLAKLLRVDESSDEKLQK